MTNNHYIQIPPQAVFRKDGPTSANLSFTGEAERYIDSATDMNKIAELRKEVDLIRSGAKTLTKYVTVEDFFSGL